jgi:hypothetical protein
MGYRRGSYNRREYGRERARRHIEEAQTFSDEVGHADEAVKQAFFALSGSAREYLLKRYGEIYGEPARAYARDTIPKWRSGAVEMSGMVAKRLFALLPPFMPAEQKSRIVEAIWRQYGPHSKKYIYIGPDSDPEAVLASLEAYFTNVNVLYPIPDTLKKRFDWLSDNDAVAKERLLNHFMDQQRQVAIAKARLYVPVMLAGMKADEGQQISKFSHTVFVGNHHFGILGDPLRSGFILSNSQSDFTRPPISCNLLAGLGLVAAIVIGLVAVNSILHSVSRSTPAEHVLDWTPLAAPVAKKQPTSHPAILWTSAPSGMPPTSSHAHSQLPPRVAQATPAAIVAAVPSSEVAASASVGCANLQIASVSGDGITIVVSDGRRYSVSDDMLMRVRASNWVTGGSVRVCVSPEGTSLRTEEFEAPVQAVSAGRSNSVEMAGCRPLYIAYTTGDGSEIATTDGSIFEVTSNMLSRVRASGWSTGEGVNVCTASDGGISYGAISQDYGSVETVREKAGNGQALQASCEQRTIERGPDEEESIRLDDGSYQIDDNMMMQVRAKNWATGDTVTVCKYSIGGTTYASIARDYGKVQATKIQ